jgi:hypothetical protein
MLTMTIRRAQSPPARWQMPPAAVDMPPSAMMAPANTKKGIANSENLFTPLAMAIMMASGWNIDVPATNQRRQAQRIRHRHAHQSSGPGTSPTAQTRPSRSLRPGFLFMVKGHHIAVVLRPKTRRSSTNNAVMSSRPAARADKSRPQASRGSRRYSGPMVSMTELGAVPGHEQGHCEHQHVHQCDQHTAAVPQATALSPWPPQCARWRGTRPRHQKK